MPPPSGFAYKLMTSPVGGLIAKPWLDRSVLYLLKNWHFPLSRLWAAARAADGNVDKFIECVPLEQPSNIQRKIITGALTKFEHARLKAFSMEQLWRDYFFGEDPVADERLPIVEEMRIDFRSAYNLTRKKFVPLRRLVKTSVAMNPPSPDEVTQRFGENGEVLKELFKPPQSFPKVEVSRPIPTAYGRDYWLRFPSPSQQMNDLAYARVHEPEGVTNPPTLIFGHGICVEFDHYPQLTDEVTYLTNLGVRVIRPEAPWHGRRVLPGHFGGEQLLSRIPLSMFDFIGAQHKEWATIIDWCRTNSKGPIAIGGSSLGAQTSKAIAMNAAHWPKHLQPDALFVVTHSQYLSEAAMDGALSDIWNLGGSLREAGWTQELEKSWLRKIDPVRPACMPGERIVSVLGTEDRVTPIRSALVQLDDWEVPTQNRFAYNRGHFSIPLGMVNNRDPLIRLAEIMRGLSQQN